MPIVVRIGRQSFLTDQRFYNAARSPFSGTMRKMVRRSSFLIPLDNR
jgi:hypothetical protein